MDIFSELASVYDIIVGDNSRYYDAIFSSIQKRFPGTENAAVADIGGGTGLFTFHIHRRVKSAVLVDPSEAMIEMAKRKLARSTARNIDIRQGGFPRSGLRGGSIDIVTVIGTLHYLPADIHLAALREIRQSLKPGGLAFLDLVNFFALIGRDIGPSTRAFHEKGLKIVEKSHNSIDPFKEKWIDTYNISVEDAASGEAREFESRHVLKMLSPTEIRLLLGEAGFSDIEVIPQQDVEEEKAVKMWCFARKPVAKSR